MRLSRVFSYFIKFFIDYFLFYTDNKSMKERLKQLRKLLELTQSEFGKKIGMSDTAISHMEAGRNSINEQNIHLICLTFGVREEWLREGKGEIMNNEALFSEREKHLLDLFGRLSPRAREMLIEYADKLVSDERTLRGEPLEEEKGALAG
jgi:transcriptional regulator with XRE-family HTH domain